MMTSKQTKIVATVSDKRCEIDFVRALYENGMNVVRMNSAHLNAEGFDRIINNVRAVSNTIAILMDTKGPEVRTTFIENDGSITFTAGDIVRMKSRCLYHARRNQCVVCRFCQRPFGGQRRAHRRR